MSLTKCLALDVECVGINGGESQIARVSIVNEYLECILDTYVAPIHPVIDYRTPISGVRRHNLVGAPHFLEIREKVRVMLKGCILVGHSVKHDLKSLRLSHPDFDIRDTSSYPPFVKMNGNKIPSLRWLAENIVYKSIQNGEHNSVEDARVTMQIYKKVEDKWENGVVKKHKFVKDNYYYEDDCNNHVHDYCYVMLSILFLLSMFLLSALCCV